MKQIEIERKEIYKYIKREKVERKVIHMKSEYDRKKIELENKME